MASLAIGDREELIHAVSTQYQVCDRRMDNHFSTAYTALNIASIGLWSAMFYLAVTEGHSNWYRSKAWLQFHIRLPQ